MQKLHLNDKADLFILSDYNKPPSPTEKTPWGDATRINTNKILKPAKTSEIGSESYRTALSRAFNRAKQKIYFNPDMTQFVTLTYADNMQDVDQLLYDIKQFLKKEKRKTGKLQKYIYTIEKQERGALHIHMICNDFLTTRINKNNYPELVYWEKGFTNIEEIKILNQKDTDSNFKPYLYLFKYMNKSQRVGNRFVHSSRTLNNFDYYTDFEFDKKLYELQFSEIIQQGILDKKVEKRYYRKAV